MRMGHFKKMPPNSRSGDMLSIQNKILFETRCYYSLVKQDQFMSLNLHIIHNLHQISSGSQVLN